MGLVLSRAQVETPKIFNFYWNLPTMPFRALFLRLQTGTTDCESNTITIELMR